MRVPFIDILPQYESLRGEIKKTVEEVLDSQHYILSTYVKKLEEAICRDLGAKEAIAVASGSDALYLSLLAYGIGPGDEVLTTPFTFFATAGSISRVGAKPVFVDIDPRTFNIDPQLLEGKITKKTKAIIPVHLYGLACDMKAIMAIAQKHGLKVIEDAAQSYGASIGEQKTGAIAEAGCLSFYPTKNLGAAGDGGMILTSSAEFAGKIRRLRDHGSVKKYIHEVIGMNSRLDEIQAAILYVKMKKIGEWNRERKETAERYTQALSGLPLKTPYVPDGFAHIYHLYTVLTQKRDELLTFLESRGVGAGVYYPLPLHLQPCYAFLSHKKGDMPNAEKASAEAISLPLYVGMKKSEVDYVIDTLKEFYR